MFRRNMGFGNHYQDSLDNICLRLGIKRLVSCRDPSIMNLSKLVGDISIL